MLIGNDSEWSVESELPGLGYNEKIFHIRVYQVCACSKNNIHQDQTLHIHNNKSKLLYVTVTSTNVSYFKYESKIIPQFIFDQNYQPSVEIMAKAGCSGAKNTRFYV